MDKDRFQSICDTLFVEEGSVPMSRQEALAFLLKMATQYVAEYELDTRNPKEIAIVVEDTLNDYETLKENSNLDCVVIEHFDMASNGIIVSPITNN